MMTNNNYYFEPSVIEKTPYGERSYDVYSRLLKDRIIFLGMGIDDTVSNLVIAQMLFLQSDEACETSYADRGGKYQGQTGVTLPKT